MFSQKTNELKSWISETATYGIPEITSFLDGIRKDIDAVENGITYEYNNGLAEGSVYKIKLVKRIMYGRNSFILLKAKVIPESTNCRKNRFTTYKFLKKTHSFLNFIYLMICGNLYYIFLNFCNNCVGTKSLLRL